MARPGLRVVVPWGDRYRRPAPEALLRGFSKSVSPLIRLARQRALAGAEGVNEQVVWLGVAWKWTLEYRTPAEPERGWVYLIPRPVRPLIAVPFPQDLLGPLLDMRLSRVARESVLNAPVVGQTCWPQWELLTKSAVEDAMTLAALALDGARQAV